MDTSIFKGLDDRAVLSMRSLQVLAEQMDKTDLIELCLLERRQSFLYRDYVKQLLLGGNDEPSANEME